MIQSLLKSSIWCLLLLVVTQGTAQNATYEAFYNILRDDSVQVTIPKQNNIMIYSKPPKNGTVVNQTSSTGDEFILTYTPNAGFLGLDTFQVVYFLNDGLNGESSKKSKRFVVRTSEFLLNSDTYTLYTTDTLVVLPILSNDILTGSEKIIRFAYTPKSNISIADDSLSLIFHGAEKPLTERISVLISNGNSTEMSQISILVKDSTHLSNTVATKFMYKNQSLTFTHPFNLHEILNAPVNGELVYTLNEITYTPNNNFTGRDTIVLSGDVTGDYTHIFYINVLDFDKNNALVEDDFVYTITNQSISFDVLQNDFTDAINVDIFDNVSNGTLIKQSNGKYKYTPNQDFSGTDAFIYRACEPFTDICEYGVVTITVSYFEPENQVELTTAKNTDLFIQYPFPVAGYKVQIMSGAYAQNGLLIPHPQQKDITYRPNTNFVGTDNFSLKCELISNPSISYIVNIQVDVQDVVNMCTADCVWPGDHNNDGRVDMRDILTMGGQVGYNGSARENTENQIWIGQYASNWNIAHNGINSKYTDADGDGYITMEDTLLFNQNYRKLHGIPVNKGVNSAYLPFFLKTDKDFYEAGEEVNISFSVGNDENPVKNLAGFTASLSFSDVFIDSTLKASYVTQHWLADEAGVIEMTKKPLSHTLDFGAARISGNGTSGHGQVVSIKGIVDDVLDGFRDNDGILYLPITVNEGTLKIDGYPILYTAPQTFYVKVKTKKDQEIVATATIIASPNPTSNMVNLVTKDEDQIINSVHVYTITGQLIKKLEKINKNNLDINLGGFPAGLYLAKTFTSQGVEVIKIEKI